MASFSDYLENKVLDHVFMVSAYTVPTHIYLALSTTSTLTDAMTGTTLTGEIATGSYARKIMDSWDAAASGATENTKVITFAQATAAWGNIKSFAITDKLTKGNILGWGKLTASKTIASGDTFKFATGDIDVTLD
jgi:hypothetical protein